MFWIICAQEWVSLQEAKWTFYHFEGCWFNPQLLQSLCSLHGFTCYSTACHITLWVLSLYDYEFAFFQCKCRNLINMFVLNWPFGSYKMLAIKVSVTLIDNIKTVSNVVLKMQHLGNISLGNLILTNLMTLWYQWSVSKLGQLPKLVGQLTSSILHRPQQRRAGFITPVSHEHALTPPSKAQLILIAWKIIICAGKSKAQSLS